MTTAFITHPSCLQHEMGRSHPECPARISTIVNYLKLTGLWQQLQHTQAPAAALSSIARVHTAEYIENVKSLVPQDAYISLDADTAMNQFSYIAALHAAGAVIHATDLVITGKVRNAFCCVRPPGHHAERNRAMGFCIFNNIAIGVAHALAQYHLERIVVLDFDVHHGNGTEDIFHDNTKVLFCSTFQHPLYPYCGADSSNHHIINTPLPAGTDSQTFRHAVEHHWVPAIAQFQPQCFFISAGFDAHREDPLANFNLTEQDYAWVTNKIVTLANQYADGKIISSLEGGYHLDALARSVASHIAVLTEALDHNHKSNDL